MALISSECTQLYSGFTPVQIPTCALWLDAAELASLTLSGTSVIAWRDKSGNGRNATGGTSPTFLDNGVVFNGTTQYLTTTYTGTPTAETVFAVATLTATTSPKNYFIIGTSTTNTRGFTVNFTSPSYTIRWDKSGIASYAPTGGVTQNVRFLADGVFTGTGGTTGFNGGAQSATAAFTFSGGGSTAIGGAGNNANTFWQGTINEIVVYSTALTVAERQQVEGYLAWKWALKTNLPVTHPYKYTPLYTRPTSPLDISGCRLWLDAADPTTFSFSSGSNVSQWNDKSGLSNHASQATVARQPTYTNSVVKFVRANSNFLSMPNGAMWSSNTPFSLFMVVAPTSTYTANVFIFQGNAGANAGTGIYSTGTTFSDYWQGFAATGWGTMTLNVKSILSYIYTQNTNIFAWEDGTGGLLRNQTAYTVNISNATLGSEVARSLWSDSEISEVIIYNSNLTTVQRQQVEGYLGWKWGLQSNLIATQPFKPYYPLTTAFNPDQIAGLQLWLDAADVSTITVVGGNVTAWADKSGNARNMTTVTVGSGSVTQSTYGGIPSVLFNSTEGANMTYMRVNSAVDLTNLTVFSVARCQGPRTNQNGLLAMSSTNYEYASTDGFGHFLDSGSDRFYGGGTPNANLVTNANPSNVDWYPLSMMSFTNTAAGAIKSWINGVPGATATGAARTATATGFGIGFDLFPPSTISNRNTISQFSELIVYNIVLTDRERERVEGYLAWRWGLRSRLPTAHPYRKLIV